MKVWGQNILQQLKALTLDLDEQTPKIFTSSHLAKRLFQEEILPLNDEFIPPAERSVFGILRGSHVSADRNTTPGIHSLASLVRDVNSDS